MHNQLLSIKNTIKNKSRLGFMFSKKDVVLAIEKSLNELEITLSTLENNLRETTENYIISISSEEKLQSDLTALDVKHNQLNQDYNQLNIKYSEALLKDKLISSLLKANYIHEGVKEYLEVLKNDFMEFANKESSLKEEAAALLILMNIGDKLKEISSYPEFYNKKIIAVGGGFSSGKSEFISSLFRNDTVKLPVGIKPTTAIPTYVMNSDNIALLGASPEGEMIDLLKIDPNIYKKLSHDFIRSFGFNLKDIMPYMVLTNKLSYKHICFVDTPGYNPSSSEQLHTDEDRQTADNFIKEAGALIWLIPVTSGTIPQSDLEFLDEVTSEEQPLYIVLNKCDQRPLSDIENIMEEIATALDDYGIEYQGISAYSSKKQQEYSYFNKSLKAFLIEQDFATNRAQEIYESLNLVNDMYKEAIQADIRKNQEVKDQLFTIRQALVSNWRNDDEDKVDELLKYFDFGHQESHLSELESVMKKFNKAIEMIFPQSILLNESIDEEQSWIANIWGLSLASLNQNSNVY